MSWDQLPDIYDRAVLSDTPGRPYMKREMQERTRIPYRGREIVPTGKEMPQPRPTGMINTGLDQMSHGDLLLLRAQPGADHGMLGPLEHRAWAREYAADSPVGASIALPFMIPGYSAAKALGLVKARSPASLKEVLSGYRGLLEGLGMLRP